MSSDKDEIERKELNTYLQVRERSLTESCKDGKSMKTIVYTWNLSVPLVQEKID